MVKTCRTCITIGGWNIDGLFKRENNKRINKLDNDEINKIIRGTDIVMLIETHCSHRDTFHFDGYTVHNQIRPKSPGAKKHFGGLSVLINNDIRSGVTYIPSNNSEFLWLKLCRTFFNLSHDVYLLVVYVCPENSPFSGRAGDIFQLIEADIAKYSQIGKCLVFGDFNGRTAMEPDFCENDENLSKFISDDGTDSIDIASPRNNSDYAPVDKNGRCLLDLCISSGLRILNGRVFGDSLGYHTCFSHNGNPSTIDYFLASSCLLGNLKYLQIFDPNVNSIHCFLRLSLSTNFSLNLSSEDKYKGMHHAINYKWNDSIALTFERAVKCNKRSLDCKSFSSKIPENRVDDLATSLNDFFHKCASDSNMICKRKSGQNSTSRKNKNKGWFNPMLSSLKTQLLQLANKIRATPYDRSKLSLFHAKKKIYKRLVKQCKYKYEQDIIKRLTDIEKSNPREFWKSFKQLQDFDKSHKENPIPPSEWVTHFHSLLNIKPQIDSSLKFHIETFLSSNVSIFNELNYRITNAEISCVINSLKSGKSPGIDSITNEMIRCGWPHLQEYFIMFFNSILTSGKFPSSWDVNTLSPLHKKGSTLLRDNYRGIAVSSAIAKVFLSVLHNRLYKFADTNDLIPPNQIGYKKGLRTTDHILVLKNIIDKYITKTPRKYLYACFVDFKSAFDTVWRDGLFYKMLKMGIGGNFIKVLQSMYSQTKYAVKVDNRISEPFLSSVGVKQGCVLSPLLFNLYLSDLPCIFDNSCDPVSVNALSTNCLLFADDLVLLSESSQGLNACINRLDTYCRKWGLTINLAKTKVIIFNKGGHKISKFKFFLQDNPIEIVQWYCYLGVIFSSCGTFTRAIKALHDKACKAFFSLKKVDTRNNAELSLKLFDVLVTPILTYAIEIWGPSLIDKNKISRDHSLKCLLDSPCCENLNVKLCKYVLGIGRKSCNDAARGELGRHPILLLTMHRWINYMKHCFSLPLQNFARASLNPADNIKVDSTDWSSKMKNVIISSFPGSDLEFSPNFLFHPAVARIVQDHYMSRYQQAWISCINKEFNPNLPNKLKSYASYKTTFSMENYVSYLPLSKRRSFTKLRVSSHRLAIETGRYTRPITPRSQRFCNHCTQNVLGDEMHFLLSCSKFAVQRKALFDDLKVFGNIRNGKDFKTFFTVMNYGHGDIQVAHKICKFVTDCFSLQPG